MIVLVTGISGSGRKEYVERVVEFAAQKKKNIRVFSVGKMLLEQAENMDMDITRENILNSAPYALKALRSAVFEKIKAAIRSHKDVIIETHAMFFWKKIFSNAYDWDYLLGIKPDMYITVIGNAPEMELCHRKSKQWKTQKLTQDDLLLWQNLEINTAKGWSDLFDKPFYAVSERQPPSTLFKLMFYPRMEPVYASFPMTHLKKPADKKRIVDFVKTLNDYFVVFDPATIELGPITTDVDAAQCVNRDLYWLVSQSKKVIGIFPQVVLSTGVINELREAFETNKEVLLVFPKKVMSPFTSYYAHKTFLTEEELYRYLKKEGYKKHPEAN